MANYSKTFALSDVINSFTSHSNTVYKLKHVEAREHSLKKENIVFSCWSAIVC